MKTHAIAVRNINDALPAAGVWLKIAGCLEPSRAGEVLVAPGPVITEYERPRERVIFAPERDANPYFHLMEALWMLAGSARVDFLREFNSRIGTYSDDGTHLHGAYGARWRSHFGRDQLDAAIRMLIADPSTRRAVVAMWSPQADLREGLWRDLPCNTQLYLSRVHGALDMTITARSNDAVWGAYGANAVHFSILQEWLAASLGIEMGRLYQFSNNLHVYSALPRLDEILGAPARDLYASGLVRPYPLVARGSTAESLALDASDLVDGWPRRPWRSEYFRAVVAPMLASWRERRSGSDGMAPLRDCAAGDWRLACEEWIGRRTHKEMTDVDILVAR